MDFFGTVFIIFLFLLSGGLSSMSDSARFFFICVSGDLHLFFTF